MKDVTFVSFVMEHRDVLAQDTTTTVMDKERIVIMIGTRRNVVSSKMEDGI